MDGQTEKLEGIIEGYLNSPVRSMKPTHILARDILQACKEAGLKFVYDIQAPTFGKQWAKFKEIEL